MLKDADIRDSLYKSIESQNSKAVYRIIPEMAICDGLARVDVAVANGRLCGYEIKSDADSLVRLSSQQMYYDRTFDNISIVVGKKFAPYIQEEIPSWWGILIATQKKNGVVTLKKERAAGHNPNVSAEALLDLLWHDEVKELLKASGMKGLSGKNRRILRKLACDCLPFEQVREFTRETLKNRDEWRPECKLNRPEL